MAGHNKWSKIKHKKAATDAQRSKIFGKIVRLISVEAKKAQGDVNAPGLRAAIEKANEVNMPKDNIERAIKKAAEGGGEAEEEVTYEAYGPAGTAIIITGLTDNRNRTAAEVKHVLSKNGAALAEPGAASWAFEKKGGEFIPQTTVELSDEDGEKLGNLLEAIEELDDVQDIFTNAD